MTTPKINKIKNVKEWFEENYLDGDKIQDGQTLASEECLNALIQYSQQALSVIQDLRDDNREVKASHKKLVAMIKTDRQQLLDAACGVLEGMKKSLVIENIILPADDEDLPEEILKRATPVIYNQALSDAQTAIKKLLEDNK